MWHLAWHATQKSSLTAHEKEISKHKKTTKCVTRRVKRCFVCSFRALHLLASHQCLFTWGESDISVSWYPEKQNFKKKKKKGTKKKKKIDKPGSKTGHCRSIYALFALLMNWLCWCSMFSINHHYCDTLSLHCDYKPQSYISFWRIAPPACFVAQSNRSFSPQSLRQPEGYKRSPQCRAVPAHRTDICIWSL